MGESTKPKCFSANKLRGKKMERPRVYDLPVATGGAREEHRAPLQSVVQCSYELTAEKEKEADDRLGINVARLSVQAAAAFHGRIERERRNTCIVTGTRCTSPATHLHFPRGTLRALGGVRSHFYHSINHEK